MTPDTDKRRRRTDSRPGWRGWRCTPLWLPAFAWWVVRRNPRTTTFFVLVLIGLVRVESIGRQEDAHNRANIVRVCHSQNELRTAIRDYLRIDLHVSPEAQQTADRRFHNISCPG